MHIDRIAPDVLYSNLSRPIPVSAGAVAYPNSEDPDPTHWHIFCVKPGMAKVAHQELRKQNFETFRPRIITKMTVDDNGKLTPTEADLFGSYHFVRFDTAEGGWPKIHYTFGVRRLLLTNSLQPATMPVDVMTDLLNKPLTYDKSIRKDPSLVGETIEVLDGPFFMLRGEVMASAAGRVTVLLSLFGRQTQTVVAIKSVKVI